MTRVVRELSYRSVTTWHGRSVDKMLSEPSVAIPTTSLLAATRSAQLCLLPLLPIIT
jgi:hypothetical protein